MRSFDLRQHLEALRDGSQSVDGVLQILRDLPYRGVASAEVDHHRPPRGEVVEVVLGRGKSPEQVSAIAVSLAERGQPVLVTKSDAETFQVVKQHLPGASFNQVARAIIVPVADPPPLREGVLVVTGGTADLPVAEEVAITVELVGSKAVRINDVGVAGLHRLLDALPALREARVVVVAAGMDAALAAVVAGLVSAPVVAVPTSEGYGASFGGLAALLSMLNSCAPGVAVLNIDNGFGAGYLAAQINQMGRQIGRQTDRQLKRQMDRADGPAGR